MTAILTGTDDQILIYAHDAVIRRIVERIDNPRRIKLVPRGSTIATALAEI